MKDCIEMSFLSNDKRVEAYKSVDSESWLVMCYKGRDRAIEIRCHGYEDAVQQCEWWLHGDEEKSPVDDIVNMIIKRIKSLVTGIDTYYQNCPRTREHFLERINELSLLKQKILDMK